MFSRVLKYLSFPVLLLLGTLIINGILQRNVQYDDGYGRPSQRPTPDPTLCVHPDGIDLSHHNIAYNWDKVDARFVYLRASLGCDVQDSMYVRHLRRAHLHKLPVGAYHFLTALTSAEEQFSNFASVVRREDLDLRPMLDVEDSKIWRAPKGFTDDDAHQLIRRWCDLCKSHYGQAPIIYVTESIYRRYHLDEGFDDCIWWVAAYTPRENFEESCIVPYTLHQYSDTLLVEGFYGPVDCDRFNTGKSVEDLRLSGRKQF